MGLTKQYLRFAPAGVFGVVAAKTCNSVYLQPSRFVACGGTHIVTLWDTRQQRKLRNLNCESAAVVLKPNDDATMLAVGHQNGALSIYDITDKSNEASPEPTITFEGHTSAVTCVAWNKYETLVASGGRDNRIVVWNHVSEAGHCKFLGHTSPVTQIKFWREGRYLVSSSFDATVRIWDMEVKECTHTIACNYHVRDFDIWLDCIIVAENHLRCFVLTEDTKTNQFGDWRMEELGTILREGNDRSTGTVQVLDNRYLIATGVTSPNLEIFILSTAAEGEKKRRKRLKKHPDSEAKFILRDLIRRWNTVKAAETKVKSVDAIIEKDNIKALCCLPSNQIQILSLPATSDVPESKDGVEPPLGFDGHRKMVRGIAFSGDKTAILTASGDCFKLWNRATLTCILTINHEYPVVCCQFCPGDRHFVAGTTCGNIILGDISSGELIQVEAGGSENVWSIDVYPNNLGFAATNGNFIQFCEFSMAEGKLRYDIKKQLDVQDSVLSVKISPDMKFIAVGLLDSTIKVFYLDTLKFHLSMYGHSLPVVAINISADGTLLVSCSGDKSVRIWGMDFGDCHCTMMHTEGLVGCSFIEKTHHVVSVAKDSINFYDADIHQRIQTVKGHVEGGATCMAVGGLFVASAGRDQTIRLFNRTQEILVLNDEREEERTAATDEAPIKDAPSAMSVVKGSSEKVADKLIEALQIFTSKDDSNPLVAAFGAKNSLEYVYKTLLGIKTADLEQSILLLPTYHVYGLFCATTAVLVKYPLSTEMAIRCIGYLHQFHNETLRTIDKSKVKYLATLANKRAEFWFQTVGANVAGLKFLSDELDKQDQAEVFKEMLGERKRKKKTKEKALKRAMLAVSSK